MALGQRPKKTVAQKLLSGASSFLNYLIYIPIILVLFATIVRTSEDFPLGHIGSVSSGKLRIYQIPTPADWFLPIQERREVWPSREQMMEDTAKLLYHDRG